MCGCGIRNYHFKEFLIWAANFKWPWLTQFWEFGDIEYTNR